MGRKLDRTLLKVDRIYVSYGVVAALKGVSFYMNEGDFIALVGSNGAGKSTLLGALLGINSVTSGSIMFRGKEITNKPTEEIVASGLCLIPEGRGIVYWMTVKENLELGGYHVAEDELDKNMERAFNYFPLLKERLGQLAGSLSGGEQQMLSIARGLISSPKILMLDEPSLGLAPIVVSELFDILAELNKEGYSILLSEQNASLALQFSRRAYLFANGEIVASGPSSKLIKDERVAGVFLGAPVE